MKKLLIILSLLSAAIALLLAVLPLSNLAYIPAILALALGITAFITQKEKPGKKTIQLSFLLTIIALGFSVYKSIFTINEIGNIDEFQQKSEQSVEESIETLEDIDIVEEETQKSFDTILKRPVKKQSAPKEESETEEF